MPRVRIIKLFKDYNVGDIVDVSPNIAHGLIDAGVGILSKDLTNHDYHTKTSPAKPVKTKRRYNG